MRAAVEKRSEKKFVTVNWEQYDCQLLREQLFTIDRRDQQSHYVFNVKVHVIARTVQFAIQQFHVGMSKQTFSIHLLL